MNARTGHTLDLSVVIPTMNKVDLLRCTLEALARQEAGPGVRWEVVVVNDGSSDGTAAYLEMAPREFEERGLTLTVVSPAANVGRARARNLGARSARGRWILFLDDDIVAPPGLLRAHLELLQTGAQVGTIGHAVTDPGLIDGAHFHYLDSRGVSKLPPGPAPGRYFVTQNAAVPREAFLAVGGFDEDFSGYGFEDMEVAFRLEDEAGICFQVLPGPVPRHVHHHTLAQYLEKKVECGRLSVGHLASRHPGRLAEMSLHHVIDVPGDGGGPGFVGRLVRWLATSSLGRDLPLILGQWPTRGEHRPLLPGLYYQVMNLTILVCFRQGYLESRVSAATS